MSGINIDGAARTGRGGSAIVNPNPNDVLLGRGAQICKHEGNDRFRKLIQAKKAEYLACTTNYEKDVLARAIGEALVRLGGRFLVKSAGQSSQEAWVIVDERTALQKVKQAFRDNTRNAIRKSAGKASNPSATSHPGGSIQQSIENQELLPASIDLPSSSQAEMQLLAHQHRVLAMGLALPAINRVSTAPPNLSVLPQATSEHRITEHPHQVQSEQLLALLGQQRSIPGYSQLDREGLLQFTPPSSSMQSHQPALQGQQDPTVRRSQEGDFSHEAILLDARLSAARDHGLWLEQLLHQQQMSFVQQGVGNEYMAAAPGAMLLSRLQHHEQSLSDPSLLHSRFSSHHTAARTAAPADTTSSSSSRFAGWLGNSEQAIFGQAAVAAHASADPPLPLAEALGIWVQRDRVPVQSLPPLDERMQAASERKPLSK